MRADAPPSASHRCTITQDTPREGSGSYRLRPVIVPPNLIHHVGDFVQEVHLVVVPDLVCCTNPIGLS
eukprot:5738907-Pyramimonas_sp.AAC.3